MTKPEGMSPDSNSLGWEDPIVAEVRVIRERIFEEAGGTLEGLVAMLRASEAANRRSLVTLPPRPAEAETDVA